MLRSVKWVAAAGFLVANPGVVAKPFHDSIPADFQGTFAPSLTDCQSEDGVEVIVIDGESINYYEGNDYLLLGISFSGSSTKSGKGGIPLFNGRFMGRMETQILGEVNARIEMETPNLLIRYRLKDDGEPESKPVNTWVRCPAKKGV